MKNIKFSQNIAISKFNQAQYSLPTYNIFIISGDGNIHLNVTVHEFSQEVYNLIEPYIFQEVSKLKGSVSAEHGIGFKKPKYLSYSKSKEAIAIMKQLKSMMDPNEILNPYKVLP